MIDLAEKTWTFVADPAKTERPLVNHLARRADLFVSNLAGTVGNPAIALTGTVVNPLIVLTGIRLLNLE